MLFIWLIAFAKLLFHIYFNNRYGYFRDEFDYIACGNHLAWGYVDQPPLIPFLIHICRAVLGDSLRAIRFIPALASSLLVVQGAIIARELGGKRYAMFLTAIAIVVAPQYLSNGSLLTTNCLEPNLWMGCAYFFILAVKRSKPRYWIAFGIVAGLGLEEKYTIALFCFAIIIGLICTEQRRAFLQISFWIGIALAFLIFLPNLLWNIHYDFPFLQLMHNIRAEGRDVVLSAGQYFLQQMLLIQPLAAPLWLAGLFALLYAQRLKPYRVLGIAYLICYAVLFFLHGKIYYLAPIYPMLLAAGAVVAEVAFTRRGFRWLKRRVPIILLIAGVVSAPIDVPLLSPDHFLAYTKRLHIKLPVMEYAHARAALPQWYADQFGWNEIVAETAIAWNELAPQERADCGIFGQDYGQAGAIDFLGRRYGLPSSLSGHQSWFLWGPRGYSGNCMIVLSDTRAKLETLFTQVDYVGTSAPNPYALEQQIPVFICRGKKFESLQTLWPIVKKWR